MVKNLKIFYIFWKVFPKFYRNFLESNWVLQNFFNIYDIFPLIFLKVSFIIILRFLILHYKFFQNCFNIFPLIISITNNVLNYYIPKFLHRFPKIFQNSRYCFVIIRISLCSSNFLLNFLRISASVLCNFYEVSLTTVADFQKFLKLIRTIVTFSSTFYKNSSYFPLINLKLARNSSKLETF